jgi:hypothetical protein
MARTTATNFSGALDFSYATAAADLFKKEDVQTLAVAVDAHDHSAGKGLAIAPAAGSIPGSAIADGSITSAKIADGTIATVDLAANAISQVVSGNSQTAESTTSATLVTLVAPAVTITSTGGELIAFFSGSFQNSGAAGGANNFVGIALDANTIPALQLFVTPGANYAVPVTAMLDLGAPAAGSHTIKAAFATSAGTLTSTVAASRTLVVIELKK